MNAAPPTREDVRKRNALFVHVWWRRRHDASFPIGDAFAIPPCQPRGVIKRDFNVSFLNVDLRDHQLLRRGPSPHNTSPQQSCCSCGASHTAMRLGHVVDKRGDARTSHTARRDLINCMVDLTSHEGRHVWEARLHMHELGASDAFGRPRTRVTVKMCDIRWPGRHIDPAPPPPTNSASSQTTSGWGEPRANCRARPSQAPVDQTAIQSFTTGTTDFVPKPFNTEVASVLARADCRARRRVDLRRAAIFGSASARVSPTCFSDAPGQCVLPPRTLLCCFDAPRMWPVLWLASQGHAETLVCVRCTPLRLGAVARFLLRHRREPGMHRFVFLPHGRIDRKRCGKTYVTPEPKFADSGSH